MAEEAHRVIVLDIMPDGQIVPVSGEALPDWSQPPEGWARPMRRRFKRLFRFYRFEYNMPEDLAHVRAVQRILKGVG